MEPKPRSGHRIVYYNGKIYSFGGYNPAVELNDPEMDELWPDSKPLFKELWELNLSTGRWTKCEMKGEVPEQLASHTAVMHPLEPGVMLIYGGTGAPFGITTSNTIVTCHLESRQFRLISILDVSSSVVTVVLQSAQCGRVGGRSEHATTFIRPGKV